MKIKTTFQWIALLVGAALIYACVSELVPATGEKHYLGYTWQQETEIGKQASKQISALYGTYRDPKIERYVSDIGNRVLATSHLRRPGADEQFRNTPVTFGVLDSPIINAMALPGGYIYITRGMLAHLNNEDQLATVLAHEIGHVAARHAARQAWQQKIGQGLLLGGSALAQGLGFGQEILNLGGMAAQLLFLRYSREDELEADKLGVEYGLAAGYDSREVIPFFQTLSRIQEKEGQGMPSFLATHPDPGARVQRIREMTGTAPARRPPPADARYMNTVENLVVGEDPRQGFVEGNTFYHPDMRFRFPVPRGFKVVNQPTQVVMVEEQNRAMLGFNASAERSAEAAGTKFLSQQGLRIVERGPMRSSGLPAYVGIADAQTQKGQILRLIAYFVEFRGTVYHFVGATSQQAFNSYRGAFLQTMQGFGELQDARMLNRQPVRLDVQTVARSGRFQDSIPRSFPAPLTAQDVAIMNQVELTQEVASGRMLKVPGAR